MSNFLLISFLIIGAIGILAYFMKGQRNLSYGLLAIAFLLLGISGTLEGHPSAAAAFILCLVAARKFKTKFDKR